MASKYEVISNTLKLIVKQCIIAYSIDCHDSDRKQCFLVMTDLFNRLNSSVSDFDVFEADGLKIVRLIKTIDEFLYGAPTCKYGKPNTAVYTIVTDNIRIQLKDKCIRIINLIRKTPIAICENLDIMFNSLITLNTQCDLIRDLIECYEYLFKNTNKSVKLQLLRRTLESLLDHRKICENYVFDKVPTEVIFDL
jgi:hypothetical protein